MVYAVLFKEIIAVYSKNNKKPINAPVRKLQNLLSNQVVCIVTIWTLKVKVHGNV
jgi:hypothetical protein